MLDFSNAEFGQIAIHKVGNRSRNEILKLATSTVNLDEEVMSLLAAYFLKPFKIPQFYQFDHIENYQDNRVFALVSELFEDSSMFFETSKKLASYLYEVAEHPNIKGGEFYVVHFKECIVDEEVVEAIGIFKSETKETFIKVYESSENLEVEQQEGININKLDKGCIIYNTEKEFGYKVSIVDKTNKNNEAVYWVDDFLKVKQREDSFYQTANYLNICKGFVEDVFNEDNNVEKTDQFEVLGRSIEYFKDKEEFNSDEFEQAVLEQPEIIDAFKGYKQEFADKYNVDVADDFSVSVDAVKKSKKDFKSILKLDKNFHVYIHGRRDFIEKGYDDMRKLNFYKLYFDAED